MRPIFKLFLVVVLLAVPGRTVLHAREAVLRSTAYGVAGFLADYARDYGYFTAEGITVEHAISSAPIGLVRTGRADVAIAGMGSAAELFLRGDDTRVLVQLFPSLDFYGVSRFGPSAAVKIKTAHSGALSGEPVLRLKAMLTYLGAKDVKINNTQSDDTARYKLLEEGGTDLVLLNSPELIRKARASGKYYISEPYDAYKGQGFRAAVITSQRVITTKGPELEKYVAALRAAYDDALTRPDRVVPILTGIYGFTAEEARAYYRDFARGAADAPFSVSQEPLDSISTGLELPEGAKKRKDVNGLLAPDYADKALKKRPGTGKK